MESILVYETIVVAIIAASATIVASLINKSRKEHKESRVENKNDHNVVASLVSTVNTELKYIHKKIDNVDEKVTHVDEKIDKVGDKLDNHINWHLDRK